ncbi:MAG: flagellar protein [Agathobacter sp.]
MNVINCRSCGKLFNVLGREKICPECRKALEDKFQQVKEYLSQNPNASVEQTATDNEVTVKQIRQWIREERLVLSNATESGIVCENCGKPICTGRFCDACRASMASELMGAIDRPKKKPASPDRGHERDRMRFLKN